MAFFRTCESVHSRIYIVQFFTVELRMQRIGASGVETCTSTFHLVCMILPCFQDEMIRTVLGVHVLSICSMGTYIFSPGLLHIRNVGYVKIHCGKDRKLTP